MIPEMKPSHHECPVRVFIGSGDASQLECKTLIHSIKKNTQRKLEIWRYNGTRNMVEDEDGTQIRCQSLPSLPDHRFATEFSLFRFLIPQLCDFAGRAIYLDSDMVLLADIGELWDIPLQGSDFAARPDAYPEIASGRWALSAMLIDCSLCRFDLERIFAMIRRGRFSYAEFAQMGKRMLATFPYRIKRLPNAWNDFDRMDVETKIIHFTDLDRQPWRYRDHRCGDVWFENFKQALDSGLITPQDVQFAIVNGHARPDLLKGNHGTGTLYEKILTVLHNTRLLLRDIKRQFDVFMTGTNV